MVRVPGGRCSRWLHRVLVPLVFAGVRLAAGAGRAVLCLHRVPGRPASTGRLDKADREAARHPNRRARNTRSRGWHISGIPDADGQVTVRARKGRVDLWNPVPGVPLGSL